MSPLRRRLAGASAGLILLVALLSPALAVRPDEVLPDPALEARARAISATLRCMVCQNQSIDDSDAELARDLRVLVRDRLKAGDSDEAVVDYVVSRYGEFVLLKPRFSARNAILWIAPILLILAGGTYIVLSARRRRPSVQALTDDERRAIEALRKQG